MHQGQVLARDRVRVVREPKLLEALEAQQDRRLRVGARVLRLKPELAMRRQAI